jgi:hypothetical protein
MRRHHRFAIVSALVLTAFPARSAPGIEEPAPLECWWRTSTAAVRVGEPFALVLTCSALQSGEATAIVDRGPLDPRAVELPPFEVVTGKAATDIQADGRLFFQYEYTLRFVSDTSFGQDVLLPALSLSYRLRTTGTTSENGSTGIERRLSMPRESVRISSIVPADARDIRDAGGTTFTDVARLQSRGRLITTTGTVIIGLGLIVALAGAVRASGVGLSKAAPADRFVSPASVLRAAVQHLAGVRADRAVGQWTPDLAARALAAVRVVADHVLERPGGQQAAGRDATLPPGAIRVTQSWPRRQDVNVWGSATTKAVASSYSAASRASADLDALSSAIARLTAIEFGSEHPPADSAVDDAVEAVEQMATRLARADSWPLSWFRRRARPSATSLGTM